MHELPGATDRILARLAGLLASLQIESIDGLEHILPHRDPFLLVANHSSRRDAIFLPAILILARGGRTVRFLADWNFRLIPGAGSLYSRSGAITLTRKDAKPRMLNRLKSRFRQETPPFEEAKHHLLAGGSVGIFPEGTVNRDPDRLLRGRRGAARLSLETQAPLVPVGIRFRRRDDSTKTIDSSSPMSIHIGRPMVQETRYPNSVPPHAVTDWNARIMKEIGRLCGKATRGDRRPEPEQGTGIGQTPKPASVHSN